MSAGTRAAALGIVVALALAAQAERLRSARPLLDAADRLQAAWSSPVTYEEPLWLHPSDISTEGDPLLKTNGPRFRTVTIPASALRPGSRTRKAAELRAMLDLFNRNNAPLQFGVRESRWGLHIVPVRIKNERGAASPAKVILDEMVEITPAARAPLEHIAAIAGALGARSGVTVTGGSGLMGLGFDRLFAHGHAGGSLIRWGTEGAVPGREALIDLLSQSATTFSWRLNCQPSTPLRQAAFCVLNVDLLTRESAGWDRCEQCRRLRPAPPPARESHSARTP